MGHFVAYHNTDMRGVDIGHLNVLTKKQLARMRLKTRKRSKVLKRLNNSIDPVDRVQGSSIMKPVDSIQVVTEATFENLEDLWTVGRGLIENDQVRRVFLSRAVVDPKAVFVSLPTRLMFLLGLGPSGPVRLTIQGRSCSMDVKEHPEEFLPLIGHTALTHLDFVVDLRSRTLIGNPAHGGEQMYELY